MYDNNDVQPGKHGMRYARLDRFLLHLLAAELSYFVLLILAGVVLAVLTFAIDFDPIHLPYATSILWPVLVFILALPVNMVAGLAGIVLSIRTRHQGYPGTGHLLNWIYLTNTAWLFILAIVFMLPPMASTY